MLYFDFEEVLWNICLHHADLPVTFLGGLHFRIVYEQLLKGFKSRAFVT